MCILELSTNVLHVYQPDRVYYDCDLRWYLSRDIHCHYFLSVYISGNKCHVTYTVTSSCPYIFQEIHVTWHTMALLPVRVYFRKYLSRDIQCHYFLSVYISGNTCHVTYNVTTSCPCMFQEKPLEPGLRLLPLFYAFTLAVNLFSVFYKGSQCTLAVNSDKFVMKNILVLFSYMQIEFVEVNVKSSFKLYTLLCVIISLIVHGECVQGNFN